jgi:ABC-type glutathione transport system ATPase component
MLDVRDLLIRYPRTDDNFAYAVRGVSFMVESGSFTGLVGESGSGKSTIIMATLGLLPPGTRVSGSIRFCGSDLLAMDSETLRGIRWKKISLVPQGALNSFTPVITIGSHMEEVLRIHMAIEGRDALMKIGEALQDVGLDPKIAKRYPHELSGGQKQRAAIALALLCSPQLLLADEPTTALDVITQAGILKLMSRLRRERGLTVLLVTHDLPMAASVCERLLVMKDGLLVEEGAPLEIISDPKHPHTKDLVDSMLL